MRSRFRPPAKLPVALALATLVQIGTLAPASAGPMVWVRQWGVGQANFVRGIAADGSGVYVLGWLTNPAGVRGSLVKFDPAGDRLWSRVQNRGDEEPVGVAAGTSGIYEIASISLTRSPYFSILRRY